MAEEGEDQEQANQRRVWWRSSRSRLPLHHPYHFNRPTVTYVRRFKFGFVQRRNIVLAKPGRGFLSNLRRA